MFQRQICSLIFYSSLILQVKCFSEVTSDQIYTKHTRSEYLMMWIGVLFFGRICAGEPNRQLICVLLFAFNEVWCNLWANSDAIQLIKSCCPVNGCFGETTLHGKQTPKLPNVNTANLRIPAYSASIVRANSLQNDFTNMRFTASDSRGEIFQFFLDEMDKINLGCEDRVPQLCYFTFIPQQ